MDRQKILGSSKQGLPTLYEAGGMCYRQWGKAVVITGSYGEKLRPCHCVQHGKANSVSAVFIAKPGMHRISVWQGNGILLATLIERLDSIRDGIGDFTWVEGKQFELAVQAAFAKACTLNSLAMFYGLPTGGIPQVLECKTFKRERKNYEVLLLP